MHRMYYRFVANIHNTLYISFEFLHNDDFTENLLVFTLACL